MKIISIVILLFISFQVCAQDIITRELDGTKKVYKYQGKIIARADVKKLILQSEDPDAIYFLNRSRRKRITGVIWTGVGSFFIVLGIAYLAEAPFFLTDAQNFAYGAAFFGNGAIFLGIGIGNLISVGKSFRIAIDRVNTMEPNLKVDINRNGIGLIYNF